MHLSQLQVHNRTREFLEPEGIRIIVVQLRSPPWTLLRACQARCEAVKPLGLERTILSTRDFTFKINLSYNGADGVMANTMV